MDRLGRSLKGIIDTVDGLRDSGIQFVSLTENIDTTTATGRAFWQFIGLMAELERGYDTQITQAFSSMTAHKVPINDIAYDLDVSRQTLRRGFERLGLVA